VLAKIPSYEASFKTFALHLELTAPLTGDASRDGRALLDAIRAGHVYTTLDALAAPGAGGIGFEASTPNSGRRARMGDFLAPDNGPVEWRATAAAPSGATLRLVCDGKTAAEAPATTVLSHRHEAGQLPAACRLEAGWNDGDRRVTWLITNPIYLRAFDPPLPAPSTAPAATPRAVSVTGTTDATSAAGAAGVTSGVDAEQLPDDFGKATDVWAIERDPQSTAAWRWIPPFLDAFDQHTPRTLEFTYQLRQGERASQYVAVVTQRVASIATATRVSFRASADKPMRLSVQVRRPLEGSGEGERWLRSIYVDSTPRDITVMFDDMRPVPPARTAHPPLDKVHALLFVVDTEHTPPGTSGRVLIDGLRFER
jgi:hypothetical protein